MICPNCGSELHHSNIGLSICLQCGYITQPSTKPSNEISENLNQVHLKNHKKRPTTSYKKILVSWSAICILLFFSVMATFFYQNRSANALLREAAVLNTSAKFTEAQELLNKAAKYWQTADTKKSIAKELSKNKKWIYYQSLQKQADDLFNQQSYDEALSVLKKIGQDYPLYDDVLKDIGQAEILAKAKADNIASSNSKPPTLPKTVQTTPKQPATVTPSQTPTNSPPPNPVIANDLCEVDASQATDLIEIAKSMAEVCKAVFPQIEQRLSSSPYSPLYRIVFDYNKYAAYAQSGVVHVSINYLRNNTLDQGLLPHELTHVVQGYSGAPGWISEGIATYMSYILKYSSGVAHCKSNERYTSGYGCTASLFNYIERVYKPTIIKDLHSVLKNKSYSDNFFVSATGKNLEQLYSECLSAECKGGQP